MGWRSVFVTSRAKLDLSMNHLVYRSENLTQRIHLSEIDSLMIESTQVALTTALLAELVKHRIRVVVCDEKHNPLSELIPYYGCHDCSKKIRQQIEWNPGFLGIIWQHIVYQKILNQSKLLEERDGSSYALPLLDMYLREIEWNDKTNREGLAAKVYFSGLFGKDFNREEDTAQNAALDYGYQMLLSCFNREVKLNGYLTELGIHHRGQDNFFNLSCDLMEPFRPVVDRIVSENGFSSFGKDEKHIVQKIFLENLAINGQRQTLCNTISIYTKSVFDSIYFSDPSLIRWWVYEL